MREKKRSSTSEKTSVGLGVLNVYFYFYCYYVVCVEFGDEELVVILDFASLWRFRQLVFGL